MKIGNCAPGGQHSSRRWRPGKHVQKRGKMSRHNFESAVAEQVGVNAAVIYQNFKFWCEKNAANEKHHYDEKVWTYNSMKAFETLFPYVSKSQIRTALDKLETS
ncbi:hypothetical protein [Parasedimentitalea denitrificans]|nr:hypothetical protein [Sedimentitalea sp. CY04]